MSCNTVLVIEDDQDIRDMLALAIEVEGYQVVRASNGQAGLDLLEKMPGPCLILLDLMMPVMNGWEFLKAMRRDDILAVIPIVVVSAFADQTGAEQVNAVMKKPIEFEMLIKLLEKYCR